MKDHGNTQLVCETEPYCSCSELEGSCECEAVDRDSNETTCDNCDAVMVRIDCDTGERVTS